jgi:hypothetical protein
MSDIPESMKNIQLIHAINDSRLVDRALHSHGHSYKQCLTDSANRLTVATCAYFHLHETRLSIGRWCQ